MSVAHYSGQEAASIPTVEAAPAVLTIIYPFVRDTFHTYDEEGGFELPTWRPGVRFEPKPPYGEDVEAWADGVGQAEFTVVSRHKPGRYPERVFFTRRFVTPDGKPFGKGKLHIVSAEKFRRLTLGYRIPYSLDTEATTASSVGTEPSIGGVNP